jgi:ABC-type spermidine/putrescine transport system permease subunit I
VTVGAGARREGASGRALAAALVVAAPVALGVAYSTAGALGLAGAGAPGLTTERVARVLGERTVWAGVAWTAWVAAAATALAVAGAVLVAVAFRGAGRADRVARALAVVPLPIPHIVAAATGVLILGQSGLLSRLGAALGLVHTPRDMPALVYDQWGLGLILTLAWKELPFLALVATSLLATRGAALEEAAQTLGAGRWATLARVTWPVLWRGLLPAAIAVFTFAFGSYEAAALLAPSHPLALPLLTLERYTDADLARRGDAYVLTLLGLAVGAALVALHEWARAQWEGS